MGRAAGGRGSGRTLVGSLPTGGVRSRSAFMGRAGGSGRTRIACRAVVGRARGFSVISTARGAVMGRARSAGRSFMGRAQERGTRRSARPVVGCPAGCIGAGRPGMGGTAQRRPGRRTARRMVSSRGRADPTGSRRTVDARSVVAPVVGARAR